MKFIHTADAHIDATFHSSPNPATGIERSWESNVRALASTVQHALDHQVDGFIHAGDAFRNGRPSAEAVMLFVDTLRPLAQAGIPIVLLDGNHETIMVPPSQRTMTHLVTETLAQASPTAEVHLVDREPRLIETSTGLQVLCLPWLSKAATLAATQQHATLTPENGDRLVTDHAMQTLTRLANQADPTMPLIFTGHATVDTVRLDNESGVARRGSETDMAHLFAEPVLGLAGLEGLGYVYGALGHIHTGQKLGERTYYSGAPNRFTLADADKPKNCHLVEVVGSRARVTRLPTDARPMHVIDLGAEDAMGRVEEIADGAVVAFTLAPGDDSLPSEVAAVVDDRGVRVARTHRKPSQQRETPTVEVVGEQVDPMSALRERLEGCRPADDVERIMGVAKEVVDA